MAMSAQRAVETFLAGPPADFLLAKQRREHIRWLSLALIDQARPKNPTDADLLTRIRIDYPDATALELRKELDYLRLRDLLTITESLLRWQLRLTYQGVDIVEYNSSEIVGIARPPATL